MAWLCTMLVCLVWVGRKFVFRGCWATLWHYWDTAVTGRVHGKDPWTPVPHPLCIHFSGITETQQKQAEDMGGIPENLTAAPHPLHIHLLCITKTEDMGGILEQQHLTPYVYTSLALPRQNKHRRHGMDSRQAYASPSPLCILSPGVSCNNHGRCIAAMIYGSHNVWCCKNFPWCPNRG